MLTGLRDRLDCLENDILFSSLTDSAKLMEQINTIEQSVEKILAKFTTSDRQQQQSPKQ
jgi:hypothetical protein